MAVTDNFLLGPLIFLPVLSLVSYLLVGLWISYASKNNFLDVPNMRSSHSVPTPIGGGIPVYFLFTASLICLFCLSHIDFNYFIALLVGGFLVGCIGFLDDSLKLSPWLRLLIHFSASIFSLSVLNGLDSISLYSYVIEPPLFRNILAVFFLVWMINLYNFMDGINGIASIQTITVMFSGSLLLFMTDAPFYSWYVPLFLGFSTLGFLFWNFPISKIFLGDIGSGFLGFTIGVMVIQSSWINPDIFWAWLILLGVFITDSTLTLIYRILCGKKFYRAHRDHLYQALSIHFSSQELISKTVGIINVFWLLPVAYLVSNQTLEGIEGIIIAYTPLLTLSIYFRTKLKYISS